MKRYNIILQTPSGKLISDYLFSESMDTVHGDVRRKITMKYPHLTLYRVHELPR